MNMLSWLIYAADVTGSVNIVTAAAVVLGAPLGVAALAHVEDHGTRDWDERMANHVLYPSLYGKPPVGDRPSVERPFKPYGKPILLGVTLALALNIAAPSKDTVYAVAASEMGERAMKSVTATKAIRALDAWLDKQIAKPSQP